MSVEWRGLSESAWHHPGLAFGLGAIAAVVVVLRVPPGPLRRALLAFTAMTALDAFFTGALSPLPAGGALAQPVSIAFVILGDLRLFVLLERFRGEARWPVAVGRAVAWSFLVPVAQAIAIRSAPGTFTDLRRIYLVYELLFVVLAAGLLITRYPSRAAKSPALGWYATSLVGFFLVQYALWVACDVLILTGADFAYALRFVPNALYYGLFLVFAAWRAPAEATA
ncbi:MAG: hypothetical protein Q8L48_18255 [Archangium sp.]|nr:hypothetical protein [Archangium sp.]